MNRYKELKIDGKIYIEQYKIDEILIENNFNWFLNCEIENVRIEILYDTLIFNSGVFFNGTWYYGVFRDGEWKSGTWENGVWYNGTWRNGTYKSGIIFNGKFFNGIIESGIIRGGNFYDIKINSNVTREDNYKIEKDNDIQPIQPIKIIERFDGFLKKLNEDNNFKVDVDPFEEDDWDDAIPGQGYEEDFYEEEKLIGFNDIKFYLSTEQEPIYKDGSPFQVPYSKKYLVLIEKNNKYYNIGEYRFSDDDQFKMFYENLGNNKIKEYIGEVFRELNLEERGDIMEILSKSYSNSEKELQLYYKNKGSDIDNVEFYNNIITDFINN